jgi:hypothetical protein
MTSIGRNQPCPCGSGKKYKLCHLRLEEAKPDTPLTQAMALHDRDEEVKLELLRLARKRYGNRWFSDAVEHYPALDRSQSDRMDHRLGSTVGPARHGPRTAGSAHRTGVLRARAEGL